MKFTIYNELATYFNCCFEFGLLKEKVKENPDDDSWVRGGMFGEKFIPYLKYKNLSGMHIVMRPTIELAPFFMLVDDLNLEMVNKHKGKSGRLIIETSPKNFQVWIHADRPLKLDEKRYWLKKMHSDPGADPNGRWGRCPGFTNRKEKYRTNNGFPYANIISMDLRLASIPILPDTIVENRKSNLIASSVKNVVYHNHNDNICRADYDTGDDSQTDFRYCIALFRRGYDFDEVKVRLITDRPDWSHHLGGRRLEGYLNRTLRKARVCVAS